MSAATGVIEKLQDGVLRQSEMIDRVEKCLRDVVH